MKLEPHKGVETQGTPDLKSFKMRMSDASQARIMQYMSDTMYQDKIGSVVREITSNGWDANKRVNSKRPVMIKITDDSFSVRDYGSGISPEKMEAVYSDMGNSDKDGSNDELGAFGVGSKTPLAYTDNFILSTIHDKLKTIYVIKTDSGMPSIGVRAEVEVDDEVGTEVTIQIKSGDRHAFEAAVKKQLVYFDNVFVEGIAGWDNKHELVVGKHWMANVGVSTFSLEICLGQVRYPFPSQYITDYCQHGNVNSAFFSFPVALKMNIGDLPVIISREQITYDDNAKNVLFNKLDAFKNELIEAYENIKDEETSIIRMLRRVVENKAVIIGGVSFNVIDAINETKTVIRVNDNFPDLTKDKINALRKVYKVRGYQIDEHKHILEKDGSISGRSIPWGDSLHKDLLLDMNDNDTKFEEVTKRCVILPPGVSYNKRVAGYLRVSSHKAHYYFNEISYDSTTYNVPNPIPKPLLTDPNVTSDDVDNWVPYIKEKVPKKYYDQLIEEVRGIDGVMLSSDIKVPDEYSWKHGPSGMTKLTYIISTDYPRQVNLKDFSIKSKFVLLPYSQRSLAESLANGFGINVALVKADLLEDTLLDHRFVDLSSYMRSSAFRMPATVAKIKQDQKNGVITFKCSNGTTSKHLSDLDYIAEYLSKEEGYSLDKICRFETGHVLKAECLSIIEYIENTMPNFFDQSLINVVNKAARLSMNDTFNNIRSITNEVFRAKCFVKFKVRGILGWITDKYKREL